VVQSIRSAEMVLGGADAARRAGFCRQWTRLDQKGSPLRVGSDRRPLHRRFPVDSGQRFHADLCRSAISARARRKACSSMWGGGGGGAAPVQHPPPPLGRRASAEHRLMRVKPCDPDNSSHGPQDRRPDRRITDDKCRFGNALFRNATSTAMRSGSRTARRTRRGFA